MLADLGTDYVQPNKAPGNTTFVAGFIQGMFPLMSNVHMAKYFKANVGDTSPNT